MPQIREQIAMVHLPPSKTLKYLFHVRKTKILIRKNGDFYLLHLHLPFSFSEDFWKVRSNSE